MWMRSYGSFDLLSFYSSNLELSVSTYPAGYLNIELRSTQPGSRTNARKYLSGPAQPAKGMPLLFGTSVSKSWRDIWFPIWLLAILFAIAPAYWLSPYRRRTKQARLGLCRHCGYDLRASPDRCPECGAERALATTPLSSSKSDERR
jgi:hypothetical protein